MMETHAILRFDGTLEQGFQVTLELGEVNHAAFTEVQGNLPAAPELVNAIDQWIHNYHRSLTQSRIALEVLSVETAPLVNLQECLDRAQTLQSLFLHWLVTPGFQIIEQRLRECLQPSDAIAVLIRSSDRRLHRLPWHVWEFIERYPHAEVVLSRPPERVSVCESVAHRIKILAILGDARGIDVQADRQLLMSLPDAEVVFLVEPSRPQVYQHLWEQRWDILFFAGHSSTHSETARGYININSQEQLTIAELQYGLRRAIAHGLQLAIFNSCDGLGLAYDLESLHIPQLIVMREPVPDRVAQVFLKQLLKSLSEQDSLADSVRQARESLQGLEGDFPCASWLPILFCNPAMPPLSWPQGRSESPSPIPKPRRALRWRSVLGINFVLTLILLVIRQLGGLEAGELWLYDRFRQVQSVQPQAQSPILLVTATTADTKKYGDPISDRHLLTVLQTIHRHQPRVIGLDIFRNSPVKDRADWQALTRSMVKMSSLVGLCNVGEIDGVIRPEIAVSPPPGMKRDRLGYADGLVPDPTDHHIRRYLLAMDEREESNCKTAFSFSFQVLRTYYGDDFEYDYDPTQGFTLRLKSAAHRFITLPPLSANFGSYQRSPTEMTGAQLFIQYDRWNTHAQTISFEELLNASEADLSGLIRDRIVIVGYESERSDRHATPVGTLYGVRIHTQVIDQLLQLLGTNRSPTQSFPEWLEIMLLGLMGIVAGSATWHWARPKWRWQMGAIAVIVLLGILQVLLAEIIWLPVGSAILMIGLNVGTIAALNPVTTRNLDTTEEPQ